MPLINANTQRNSASDQNSDQNSDHPVTTKGKWTKKKVGILCLFLVAIIVLIVAFSRLTGSKDTIVGTWQWVENPSSQVTFTDDGKCIITGQSGDSIETYSISGNKITINFGGVNPVSETYTFSIGGNKLILGPDTYTRMK